MSRDKIRGTGREKQGGTRCTDITRKRSIERHREAYRERQRWIHTETEQRVASEQKKHKERN